MKKLVWAIPFLILLGLPTIWQKLQSQTISYHDYQITGKITDEESIKDAVDVVLINNDAANSENIEAYLDTLSPESRKATKKELTTFFKTYDVTHDILSIKVLEQSNQKIVLEVTKESHNHNQATFTDHRAENVITLQKQAGNWQIVETFLNNTQKL
ncbi:hypothetical protein [Vagococcus lutrae]|uniref:hypothetical protein n=1 Tax=Vagococcus lutrae TaxID=81947 RepID=UPI000F87CD64|nr:hypothetical protein [Vagococcus lutrae]RST91987.1 hypothetical protein CBF33_05275 [Vagococcus lutrae]